MKRGDVEFAISILKQAVDFVPNEKIYEGLLASLSSLVRAAHALR